MYGRSGNKRERAIRRQRGRSDRGMRAMDLDTSKGHPDMDYREHVSTYKGFLRLTQFAVVFLVLLMVAMYVFLVPKA